MANIYNPFNNLEPFISTGADFHLSSEHCLGLDLVVKSNKEVDIYALTSGTVVTNNGSGPIFTTFTLPYQNYSNPSPDIGAYMSWGGPFGITLLGDDGIYYSYAHLSSNNVAIREKIKAGQKIGFMGNRGNSYGSHLHLQIGYNKHNHNWSSKEKIIFKEIQTKIIKNGPWKERNNKSPQNDINWYKVEFNERVKFYDGNGNNVGMCNVNEHAWVIKSPVSNWYIVKFNKNIINDKRLFWMKYEAINSSYAKNLNITFNCLWKRVKLTSNTPIYNGSSKVIKNINNNESCYVTYSPTSEKWDVIKFDHVLSNTNIDLAWLKK